MHSPCPSPGRIDKALQPAAAKKTTTVARKPAAHEPDVTNTGTTRKRVLDAGGASNAAEESMPPGNRLMPPGTPPQIRVQEDASGNVVAGFRNWRKTFAVRVYHGQAKAAANLWCSKMASGLCQQEATKAVHADMNIRQPRQKRSVAGSGAPDEEVAQFAASTTTTPKIGEAWNTYCGRRLRELRTEWPAGSHKANFKLMSVEYKRDRS